MIYSKEPDKGDNNIWWRLLRLEGEEDKEIFAEIAAPAVANAYCDAEDLKKSFKKDPIDYLYSIPENAFQKILDNFGDIPEEDRKGVVMRKVTDKQIIRTYSLNKEDMEYGSLYNKFPIGHICIDKEGNIKQPIML